MKFYNFIGLIGVLSVFSFGAFAEDFTTHPEGDADFVTFINQQRQEWDINGEIIATGERGDFLTYINETPEILQIYNSREKRGAFLSIDPTQYIQPGKCLVNTIGHDILQEMGAQDDALDCSWRLFCGGEINGEEPYAIQLCGKMVMD